MDSFEAALKGDQFQDKITGWRKFADEASFIDYSIVNELSRNVDGYRLSAYFNKDRQSKGGKIFAGPAWDYDLAFRNANYCRGAETTGWAYQFNRDCPQDFWQVPFWWYQFEKDSAYQSAFRCRWKQVREASLSDTRIFKLIDSVVALTAEARTRHFQRWPILGQYIWPNPQPIPATYDGEISSLKEWLTARISWISSAIPNAGPCYDYPAAEKASIIAHFYPNPVEDNFSLDIKSKITQKMVVRITDAAGRTMLSQSYSLHYGENFFTIQTSQWAPGIYVFSYQADSGEKGIKKLVKQ